MGVRGRRGGVSPEVSYPRPAALQSGLYPVPPTPHPPPPHSRQTNPNIEHQRLPTPMHPRAGEGGSLGWEETGTTSRAAGQLDYCP